MFDTYEISNSTLAVIPINSNQTEVIEKFNHYIINKNCVKIIDDSCKFFGSSLDGRHDGTKNLIGVSYKPPIIVEESSEIIFFPTNSVRNKDCIWISLKNLERFHRDGGKTKIIFKNGVEIDLKVSYETIENQVLRSTRLESVLRNRKNF